MKTITVSDYAKMRGLSIAAVYKQMHKNKLPDGVSYIKVGSVYLIQMKEQFQAA